MYIRCIWWWQWCLFKPMLLQVRLWRGIQLLVLILVLLFVRLLEMVLMEGTLYDGDFGDKSQLDHPQSMLKKMSQPIGLALIVCHCSITITCSCQSQLVAAGSVWAPRSPLSPSSGPGPSRKSCQSPWTTSPGGQFMNLAVFSSSAQKWHPKDVLAHSDWVFNQPN